MLRKSRPSVKYQNRIDRFHKYLDRNGYTKFRTSLHSKILTPKRGEETVQIGLLATLDVDELRRHPIKTRYVHSAETHTLERTMLAQFFDETSQAIFDPNNSRRLFEYENDKRSTVIPKRKHYSKIADWHEDILYSLLFFLIFNFNLK